MDREPIIATRESRLALWQAEHVRTLLAAQCGLRALLLGMTTRGDQILDRTLSKVGGKGLFVKELETALEERRADLAVHSLKDVPMDLPAGFVLAAVLEAVIGNLQTASENQAAARSRIMDADFAAETAALSRAQILQQAGNAMVAQANQLPQQVLSLLGR